MENRDQFESRDRGPALTCAEFDALLTDALDGELSVASKQRFDLHRQQCATCGPLFEEAFAGMNWLNALGQVEPPVNLVHNILAATSTQTSATLAATPKRGWKERLSTVADDLLAPVRAVMRQPRVVMTAAMALFSITLTLNLIGVKLSDIRHIDLRPSAIKQNATMKYYETSSRVVKYYENIRLVYEVESRLQELRRATSNTDEQAQPRRQDRNKSENEKDRERKQNYYSMDRQNTLLAKRSTNELKKSGSWDFNSAVTDAADPLAKPPAVTGGAVSLGRVIAGVEQLSTTELSRGLEHSDKSMRSFHA
ncbi:MAG TPA: zf-HC2 domain-containing protein [Terriglobales bacterium]|nr:zf-HC2 domain-containing protein [Terriglobales bacterium]